MSKRPRQKGLPMAPPLFQAELVEGSSGPTLELPKAMKAVLKPLASLRMTVALLAMAIFLIFALAISLCRLP